MERAPQKFRPTNSEGKEDRKYDQKIKSAFWTTSAFHTQKKREKGIDIQIEKVLKFNLMKKSSTLPKDTERKGWSKKNQKKKEANTTEKRTGETVY